MPVRPPQHRPLGWTPAPRKRAEARDPFYGTAEWRRLAAATIERDGGICGVCGRPGANTAHHITERRKGGADAMRNLLAVHGRCHNRYHPEKGFRP